MVDSDATQCREAIIKDIITIYIEVIGFFDECEKQAISEKTNMARDFKIDSDDLSLAIAEIYRHFLVKPTQTELDDVQTIGEIADLVIAHDGHAAAPYTTYQPTSAWPQWMKALAKKIGFSS